MKESHFVSEYKTFAWCKKSTFAFVKLIRNKDCLLYTSDAADE